MEDSLGQLLLAAEEKTGKSFLLLKVRAGIGTGNNLGGAGVGLVCIFFEKMVLTPFPQTSVCRIFRCIPLGKREEQGKEILGKPRTTAGSHGNNPNWGTLLWVL